METGPHIEQFILTVEEFIRDMYLYRDDPHMVFLGAGASLSSGIPTAADCIGDWKRRIYLSRHPGRTLPASADIEKWLSTEPDLSISDGESEYSFFARKCYRNNESRRSYFDELC